nr:type II toxin-antitoxin system HipA family toxin [uncultured Rhodopila sp.]
MSRGPRTPPFRRINALRVELAVTAEPLTVGRLAARDRVIYFEYDRAFLATKLELSPFRLPLAPGVFEGPETVFDRLHGLFNDSLPDGWGRLLMDRKLSQSGIPSGQLTPLDRLAWVGRHGMGALTYYPEHPERADAKGAIDLDRLAEQSRLVLEDNPKAVLDELLKAGGSPHGARPKALVGVSAGGESLIHGVDDLPDDYEHWIVKFRAASDPADAGAVENAYAGMAREAGIDMPPTRLFPAKKGPGYFGIKRFDRIGNRRVHMQTISGLLNLDHTLPSLGYSGLLKAARMLTRRQAEVDRLFARMVFNVLAHNRDDHTKNHSFLMAGGGQWSASPAYDVTFASGPGGEHALDVGGEGRSPGPDHIRAVARDAGVTDRKAAAVIARVKAAIDRWPAFASGYGVSKKMAAAIDRTLNGVRSGPPRSR